MVSCCQSERSMEDRSSSDGIVRSSWQCGGLTKIRGLNPNKTETGFTPPDESTGRHDTHEPRLVRRQRCTPPNSACAVSGAWPIYEPSCMP
jgi:hypothetical protein